MQAHAAYTAARCLKLSEAAALAAAHARDAQLRTTLEAMAGQWRSLADVYIRLERSRALLKDNPLARIGC